MAIGLYDASVPVFRRYLNRLAALIDSAEAYARRHALPPSALLSASLAPDMFAFDRQVRIAANFAVRACFPLAGQDLPADAEFPATFDGARSHVAHVLALLDTLVPEHFDGDDARVLQGRAGEAVVSLAAPEFLLQYALPNFFFHLTAAYAILRSRGVEIGKAHFDGFHSYPPPR